jgi:hypothetical protein
MSGRKTIERKIKQYEAKNREAAAIILADPERYPGAMQEWARRAYRRAFHTRDPWRDGLSEADLDDLSDLMAWHRR